MFLETSASDTETLPPLQLHSVLQLKHFGTSLRITCYQCFVDGDPTNYGSLKFKEGKQNTKGTRHLIFRSHSHEVKRVPYNQIYTCVNCDKALLFVVKYVVD